jgi:CRISPR-associated protein Cas5d
MRNVQSAMAAGRGDLGLYVEDERQQRAGLFLRDVAYRLHADMEVRRDVPNAAADAKYWDMFERRAAKGQCINQPYLGCREFACDFRLITDASAEPLPIAETRDLGWMLHDLDFADPADPQPRFFRAQMNNGVVTVPSFHAEELRT